MHARSLPSFGKLLGVVLLLAVLTLAGCGGGGSGPADPNKPGAGVKVTIGSKNDPDGQLHAQMYALLLQDKGYEVTLKRALGQTPVLFESIRSGAIDIYPEFTGTALSVYKLPSTTDPTEAYNRVKNKAASEGLVWLDAAFKLNDSYGICTSQANAQRYNLTTIEDLGPVSSQLVLGYQQDAVDIYKPVFDAYKLNFKSTTFINEQLSYAAVKSGDIQVNECYTTNPSILTENFVLLEDTKNVFPPYNSAPVVRKATLDRSPAIATTLNPLAAKLTTEKITQLIKQISVDKKDYPDVARAFLQQEGLLT